MKQSEKNQKSRALILTHAFTEFASHGYEGSSLNHICARGNLSKGLLYHYYKNKDALYLSCVHVLFDDMTRYLRSEINLSTVTVEQYFTVRMRFFRQHPLHRKLFSDLLLYPQNRLQQEIGKCRAEFDAFNNAALQSVLQKEPLRSQLSMEEALLQFRSFVHFLGIYIREDAASDAEQKANDLLQTMLYGLLAR